MLTPVTQYSNQASGCQDLSLGLQTPSLGVGVGVEEASHDSELD